MCFDPVLSLLQRDVKSLPPIACITTLHDQGLSKRVSHCFKGPFTLHDQGLMEFWQAQQDSVQWSLGDAVRARSACRGKSHLPGPRCTACTFKLLRAPVLTHSPTSLCAYAVMTRAEPTLTPMLIFTPIMPTQEDPRTTHMRAQHTTLSLPAPTSTWHLNRVQKPAFMAWLLPWIGSPLG